MELNEAIGLLDQVLMQAFDEEAFIKLICAIFKIEDFDRRTIFRNHDGNNIANQFKNHIQTFSNYYSYSDDDALSINVISVKMHKDTGLLRARTMQREFLADYIKNISDTTCDYVLAAFYNEESDWRLSFVKLEYVSAWDEDKKKFVVTEEKSPAKRFSFLVGENEPNHTARECLRSLLINTKKPSIKDDIEPAFSVESVGDEFFEKYRELFCRLEENLRGVINDDKLIAREFSIKKISSANFVKKLLGQIVFLYFLQKKGWLGVKKGEKMGSGSRRFLRDLFEGCYVKYDNFFNDILEPLFYEALAVKRGDDDYYERLECRVPFLNGGLFEPTGGYDWRKTDIVLDNLLFSNETKTRSGDVGDGILDILDRYNFTVAEDEPLEKEIAVDPEMLGKVFERLLEVNERKDKGAFYTPREIVSYMCRESIRNYLKNSFRDIDFLFDEDISLYMEDTRRKTYTVEGLLQVKEVLIGLKVCDPACGSGAFLIGMLNEILALIEKIDLVTRAADDYEDLVIKKGQKILYQPDDELSVECVYQGDGEFGLFFNGEDRGIKKCSAECHELSNEVKQRINVFNKERKKNTTANLFSQGKIEGGLTFNSIRNKKKVAFIRDEEGRVIWEYKNYKTAGKYRQWRLETDNPEYLYRLKKSIIENSIFGVDIDPGAVELAKLRFWLSLVVDYEGEKVHPLPNLDFKIICNNSLISRYELDSHINEALKKSKIKISDYQKAHKEYINAADLARKQTLRQLIKEMKQNVKVEFEAVDPLAKKQQAIKGKLEILNAKELFEIPEKEKKAKKKEVEKKQKELDKIEKQITERDTNALYENAFEWRFEFPDLLDNQAEFIGFDIIVGNPPYVQLQKLGDISETYGKMGYSTFTKSADLYCLFYERAYQILHEKGLLCFITSNKWMRAGYGKALRSFFVNRTTPQTVIDFGDTQLFKNATTYTNIMLFSKNKYDRKPTVWDLSREQERKEPLEEILDETAGFYTGEFSEERFLIVREDEFRIKKKVEEKGIPLKEWDIEINYGIKTGLNEAFIIDTETKERLIREDPKSAEVIKPILRGRDIKKYQADWQDLWIIFTRRGINIESYPAIKNYLEPMFDKLRPRNNNEKTGRKPGPYEWFEIQDNVAYWKDFEKEKIIWGNLNTESPYCFDDSEAFINAPANLMTSDSVNLKALTALMNSRVTQHLFCDIAYSREGGFYEYKKVFVEQVPIIKVESEVEKILETLVDKIQQGKKRGEDTARAEHVIDLMVYGLYGLSYEEALIVDPGLDSVLSLFGLDRAGFEKVSVEELDGLSTGSGT